MSTQQEELHTQSGRAAAQIFLANEHMNQMLLEQLNPSAWRAKPPGSI